MVALNLNPAVDRLLYCTKHSNDDIFPIRRDHLVGERTTSPIAGFRLNISTAENILTAVASILRFEPSPALGGLGLWPALGLTDLDQHGFASLALKH
jgi:hypothetical protein